MEVGPERDEQLLTAARLQHIARAEGEAMRNRNGRYDAVRLYCGTSAESLPRKCEMFFDSYFNALILMLVLKRIAIGDLEASI
jgi:hypothetical protein